jgi:hypothetical protein
MTARKRASLLAAFAVLSPFARLPALAHIHHGSNGENVSWYPADCCQNGDCQPVTRVRRSQGGLLLTGENGLTLFFSSQKPRLRSRDGLWHICVDASEIPVVRCVFEPIRYAGCSATPTRASRPPLCPEPANPKGKEKRTGHLRSLAAGEGADFRTIIEYVEAARAASVARAIEGSRS